ncbi:MAG TPA: carboxypeptidase-like regulatory domain-containing protein, partial [Gemmatimonadales bacterium]
MNKSVGLFVAALMGFGATSAWAQERQITGVVSATGGGPITGVSVSVVGTTFTTVTHEDGRYVIAAPAGAVTVLFRRIGFKRKEVSVAADQASADVELEQDVFNLEAVVVTGQQTGIERRNAAVATT